MIADSPGPALPSQWWMLLLSSVMVLAVGTIVAMCAETSEAMATMPWDDDFDDGDLENWTVTEMGSGVAETTSSQYVSADYSLHIKSPADSDAAKLELDIDYDGSESYFLEVQFRWTGPHHWVTIVQNWEMQLVLDGGSLLVREHHSENTYVMGLSEDTWYHMKVLHNATSLVNTLWVDGTRKLDFDMDEEFSGFRVGELFWVANNGEAFYDDFKMYYDVPTAPPRWLGLSAFEAVEDVPLVQDLSSYVDDSDTPKSGLELLASSSYVTAIDGLTATFLFPDGVVQADVPMWVSDGLNQVQALLPFTIEAVNDPPRCTIGTVHTAVEDVPYVIDFLPHITDVDNETLELGLTSNSSYARVSRLNLIVTFPDGVLSETVWVSVTDWLLSTPVRLEFTVTPVDDPPEVSPLPPFLAVEDLDSVLDLTPYLSDVDTPVGELRVLVREDNCTVLGKELHFLFRLPVEDRDVTIEVADAQSRVTSTLRVSVSPANDPPRVGLVPTQTIVEGEDSSIDLSPYIMDEDDTDEELVLSCSHPAAVGVSGLNLVLLYTAWEPEHTVEFGVFDGIARSGGTFVVQVQAVNDAPVVLGLGDLVPPVVVTIDEGGELWLEVHATDEDSTAFKYTLTSVWDGLTVFQNGTLRVTAVQSDLGGHDATLVVDDLAGGKASMDFSVVVSNVNDPPSRPLITKPLNHTTVEEGTNVTFGVEVTDPDMPIGQVITVTWVSNVSGLLRTLTSDGRLEFTTNMLPVGSHNITVTATDGTFVRGAWSELTVIARYVPPPPPPDEPSFLTRPAGIAAVLAVILLVIIVALLGVSMARRSAERREEEERAREAAMPPPPGPVQVEMAMEGDLAKLSRDLGQMASQLEAQRAAEAAAAPPSAPPPQLEPVAAVPTVEEEADRERTREVREVMRALTQLPQGLPTSLSGWDMAELGAAIVDGPRRTAADGTPLVLIKGRWYCSDRGNVGTFAREWKEPEATEGRPLTAGDRRKKLEQLETALLEGKISEKTYMELKAKYESGK